MGTVATERQTGHFNSFSSRSTFARIESRSVASDACDDVDDVDEGAAGEIGRRRGAGDGMPVVVVLGGCIW
jgi:hypothetical protein